MFCPIALYYNTAYHIILHCMILDIFCSARTLVHWIVRSQHGISKHSLQWPKPMVHFHSQLFADSMARFLQSAYHLDNQWQDHGLRPTACNTTQCQDTHAVYPTTPFWGRSSFRCPENKRTCRLDVCRLLSLVQGANSQEFMTNRQWPCLKHGV